MAGPSSKRVKTLKQTLFLKRWQRILRPVTVAPRRAQNFKQDLVVARTLPP